jgi:hypothetical protein
MGILGVELLRGFLNPWQQKLRKNVFKDVTLSLKNIHLRTV